MKKIRLFMMAFALMLSTGATAQEDVQQTTHQQQNTERPPIGPDGRPSGRPHGQRPDGPPPGGFGGHGSQQKDIKYTGAKTLTTAATETGKAYESSKADECALLISNKKAVTITQPTISKTGDSDGGDNCHSFGRNLKERYDKNEIRNAPDRYYCQRH